MSDTILRLSCPADDFAGLGDGAGSDFLIDGGVTASHFYGELAPHG